MEFIHLHEEAKTLVDEEVNELIAFLKINEDSFEINEWELGRWNRNFRDLIDQFLSKNKTNYAVLHYKEGSALVLINEVTNKVIKLGGTTSVDDMDYFPTRSIPTSYGRINNLMIRIQPLADTSYESVMLAIDEFKNLTYKEKGYDAAERNFAVYLGKPVIIDW